ESPRHPLRSIPAANTMTPARQADTSPSARPCLPARAGPPGRRRFPVTARSWAVTSVTLSAALLLLLLCAGPPAGRAQLTERPGNSRDDPVLVPHDLTGLSIKTPRVRVVHTTNPWLAGGSMYLQQVDPWLGYQWGRNLTQREF